jgi:uncharacterized protein YecE (DUF72 family)
VDAAPFEGGRKIDVVTGPFAYIRLLGDREVVDSRTKTLDRIVVDRSAENESDAKAMRLLGVRVPVYVFVNNHFAGFAHETIRQLKEVLDRTEL